MPHATPSAHTFRPPRCPRVQYNWGMPHTTAMSILKGRGVRLIRTFVHDSALMAAVAAVYGHDPVSLVIAIPNGELAAAASDGAYMDALMWQVVTYGGYITGINVGNEPWAPSARDATMPFLLSAFNNVVAALQARGLAGSVKVAIPWSAEVLINTYPGAEGGWTNVWVGGA